MKLEEKKEKKWKYNQNVLTRDDDPCDNDKLT